jgi:hypothetical protein
MNAVKDQMKEMKCNLSEERDECLVKKMWLDKGVQFKRKANEKQYQFNELVQDSIEVAQKSLHSCPPTKYGVIGIRMLLRREHEQQIGRVTCSCS